MECGYNKRDTDGVSEMSVTWPCTKAIYAITVPRMYCFSFSSDLSTLSAS